MLKNLLGSIFGTRNDRLISNYKKLVTQINALEEKVKKLKDADFKNKTEEFKERITRGMHRRRTGISIEICLTIF